MQGLMAHCGTDKVNREALALFPTPDGTATHRPIPHIGVVEGLLETLSFRHINVVRDEYAVSKDGMKMFGVLDLETGFEGCRFSLGLRNAHDKSMRLAMTVGFRVFVCDNMAFSGDFTPVTAKHTKHFDLLSALAIGVDQMQRGFKPMADQVASWKGQQLEDSRVKNIIYDAFIGDEVDAPQHMARTVAGYYYNPMYPEFAPRTLWSLQNAFTSAFKSMDPIPQFKATASLGGFFRRFSDN